MRGPGTSRRERRELGWLTTKARAIANDGASFPLQRQASFRERNRPDVSQSPQAKYYQSFTKVKK